MTKITVLDTTLRDGAQADHVSFSLADKLKIFDVLDSLGFTYIEAGNPYSNPKDAKTFRELKAKTPLYAKVTAFGATCRKGAAAQSDEGLRALVDSGAPVVCIFGKAWRKQTEAVLEASPEENLRMIADSVAYLKSCGREVIFDAEHFFSGFADDPDYALAAVRTAADAGADIIALCDTNGAAFPDAVKSGVTAATAAAGRAAVGIHCHNDCGMAVANTIAAVQAGATHIQGTFLGVGERCGNANLSTVVPDLQLKLGYDVIPEAAMAKLSSAAIFISEVSNMSMPRFMPYVGRSAFAHKAGMHAAAVLKDSQTFEHIDPAVVGNERRILISEAAGRSSLISKLKKFLPEVDETSDVVRELLRELKAREAQGYEYEAARASFELFCRRFLGGYQPFYELINFKVINEQPAIPGTSAMAMVKIGVGGSYEIASAEGVGPVNAMDRALRTALSAFYPTIADMHLTDFKVRVLEVRSGTDVAVRVLIESTDGARTWTTTGVSADIIEASYRALADSIEYKLLRDGTARK